MAGFRDTFVPCHQPFPQETVKMIIAHLSLWEAPSPRGLLFLVHLRRSSSSSHSQYYDLQPVGEDVSRLLAFRTNNNSWSAGGPG